MSLQPQDEYCVVMSFFNVVLHVTCRLHVPSKTLRGPEDRVTCGLHPSDQIKQPGVDCPAKDKQIASEDEPQMQFAWDPHNTHNCNEHSNSHLDLLMELEGYDNGSNQTARYPSGLLKTKTQLDFNFSKMQAIISLM